MTNKNNILILGAGVSGLSTGILLLKADYKVHMWAKDLPPNTTSNVAGAFWYPYLAEPKDKVTKWCGTTLKYLEENTLTDPNSGCLKRTVYEYFDHKAEEPWWRSSVEVFRRLNRDELSDGYVDGFATEAILMDTSLYMPWLLSQYQQLGGTLEQKAVSKIEEALADHSVVINCTGLGARELLDDKEVYPVRGQIVKVKPNGFEIVVNDDEGPNGLSYIVPRVNDIILGGTHQDNDWNLEPDPKDTEDILRKAQNLAPIFKNAEITEIKVGLRPARSEIRLEAEQFGDKTVVHNYGHGGSGFTLAWGCASDVVKLVSENAKKGAV